MAVDKYGVFRYEDSTPVRSIPALLNLGLSSVSEQVKRLKRTSFFGAIRIIRNVGDITGQSTTAKEQVGQEATPTRPIIAFATTEKMLVMYDGTTITRLAGGELYQYTYLTGSGNHTMTAGQTKVLGNTTVTLPAASQLTLSLSALTLPDGGAAGTFWPTVNGQRIAPNASWTSYGTNSRMSIWFSWVVKANKGQNNIEWHYQHSTGNNGAKTILSTVHTWVRY